MDMEIEHRLTEVESRSKSNAHRLDEMEKRQDDLDELVSTVKVLADREVHMENDVKEIKDDVKSLKMKPLKHWDSVVNTVLIALVTAIAGFLLARLGL